MAFVSLEQLRPFPEPEWLQEPAHNYLGLWLLLFLVLCLILLLVLGRPRFQPPEPTLWAIWSLLSLRAAVASQQVTLAHCLHSFSSSAGDLADFSPPARQILENAYLVLRLWLEKTGQSAHKIFACSTRSANATIDTEATGAMSQRAANGFADRTLEQNERYDKRWHENQIRLQRLMENLEHVRFSRRQISVATAMQYVDEAVAILTGWLCPARQAKRWQTGAKKFSAADNERRDGAKPTTLR